MSPNKNFTLDVQDIDIIENALNYQIGRLIERRLTHVESTIVPESELESVREIDREVNEIRNLLGRLHNQKVWYRPKNKIYVGG